MKWRQEGSFIRTTLAMAGNAPSCSTLFVDSAALRIKQAIATSKKPKNESQARTACSAKSRPDDCAQKASNAQPKSNEPPKIRVGSNAKLISVSTVCRKALWCMPVTLH